MNKRIALSGLSILTALALIGGATFAFFSDVETSHDNILTAGKIDLKIDNNSYYNGQLSQSTTWGLSDLTVEKFFNFNDVKPGDYGEDTVSLHVFDNNAWACADLKLTSNNDNGLTDAEDDVDATPGVGEGELADHINFIWWADDGDNVLETGEQTLPFTQLGNLGVGGSARVTLSDSGNVGIGTTGPLSASNTYHIGKAWCFGTIGAAPLTPGAYTGPDANNNGDQTAGTPADGGISCDGSSETNITQTDSLTADVSFYAEQSRNNSGFLCNPQD